MATDQDILLLQMSADIRGLQTQLGKAGKLIDVGAREMQRRLDSVKLSGSAIGAAGNAIGASLDAVFSRARLASIEEGSTRLGLFGSALEHLGLVGVAAGAGIGAFALGLEGLKKAGEYAEGIERTAKATRVSTDEIQKWRFVVLGTGGDIHEADTALLAFGTTLSGAITGLMPRAAKAFASLGFTKAQLMQMQAAGTGLDQVVAKIAELKNAGDQNLMIHKLGLDGLAPAIHSGIDNINKLKTEAVDLGYVMGGDVVESLSSANAKMKELSSVAGVQLAEALSNLAPLILGVGGAFVSATKNANDFFAALNSAAPGGAAYDDREYKQRLDVLTQLHEKAAALRGGVMSAIGAGMPALNALDPRDREKEAQNVEKYEIPAAQRSFQQAGMAYINHFIPKPVAETAGTGSGGLKSVPAKGKHAPSDDNSTALDAAEKAEVSAHAALLAAILSTAHEYGQQVATAKAIADAKDQEVEAEQKAADDRADKLFAEKHITAATRDQIKIKDQQVAADKKRAIAIALGADLEQRAAEHAQHLLDQQKAHIDAATQMAGIDQEMAKTASQRLAIALQILALEHAAEQAQLQLNLTNARTAEDKAAAQKAIDDNNALYAKKQAGAANSNQSLVAAGRTSAEGDANSIAAGVVKTDDIAGRYEAMYAQIDKLQKANELSFEQAERAKAQIAAQYTEERLQNASTFFGNLATLSNSSNKKIAAIGKAAAIAQATIDGFVAVQKALASAPPPFNFALAAAVGVAAAANVAHIAGVAGFAKGTDSAPGGLSLVGERGPELVNLPRGAQVIPNDILRNISAPRVGHGGGASTVIIQVTANDYFDAQVAKVSGPIAVQAATLAASAGAGLAAQRAAQRARQTL